MFLNNNGAILWAFEQCIDINTPFDGNFNVDNIISIIYFINYKKLYNETITEKIITDYNVILSNMIELRVIDNSFNFNKNCYVKAGWFGHYITVFWELKADNKWSFGFINCGQGCEFQGYDGYLTNGLIIIDNLEINDIKEFIISYKNFYNYMSDNGSHLSDLYGIFYTMVIKYLLKITITDEDYKVILTADFSRRYKNFRYYKLLAQTIGSCKFTNLIHLIYHLYIKDNITVTDEKLFNNYLDWYDIIKIELQKEILKIFVCMIIVTNH